MVRLHNTLTKKIEPFEPLSEKEVRMYSCGPTVYDHIHIGNLASFIAADTLTRALKRSGYQVKRVMNFTDVDDKTIRRARETYPELESMQALQKLTRNYEEIFKSDMKAIGNDIGSIIFVRATESIDDMQSLIKKLLEAGVAYVADDGVYFSLAEYKKKHVYGQLSTISESSTAEARIDNDEYDKDSVHDFALWKAARAGEPSWPFELDGKQIPGRPGWHIECSAMAAKHLGQPFDIHTGGIDLIFPHHENEIAQSTATTDDPRLAAVFVHNEHVLVDNRKMAKSANNFVTLEDVKAKNISPLAFRLLMLQGHYQNQINFTWQSLEAAAKRLLVLQNFAALIHQSLAKATSNRELIESISNKILGWTQANLDTPRALGELSTLVDTLGESGLASEDNDSFGKLLELIDDLFGLGLASVTDISETNKKLIEERNQARSAGDYAKADQLRDELAKDHIEVRDTPNGAIWQRTA